MTVRANHDATIAIGSSMRASEAEVNQDGIGDFLLRQRAERILRFRYEHIVPDRMVDHSADRGIPA